MIAELEDLEIFPIVHGLFFKVCCKFDGFVKSQKFDFFHCNTL
jgi:hypothetical protein